MITHAGVWKPTTDEKVKKIAGSCELVNAKVTGGGGSALIFLYDADSQADVNSSNLKWVLDSSQATPDSDKFDGLVFNKGVFAVCDQGYDTNAYVCIATRKYTS